MGGIQICLLDLEVLAALQGPEDLVTPADVGQPSGDGNDSLISLFSFN